MITWNRLVECIEKLETLPNGGGSEIEFTYNDVTYGIVSYPESVEISIEPKRYYDGKTITYRNEYIGDKIRRSIDAIINCGGRYV